MNRLLFLLAILLVTTMRLEAQQYLLSGTLVADSTLEPLEAATIMLLDGRDSSLVNFGRSDEKGFFEIKNISNSKGYLLRISYVGYATYDHNIPQGQSQNPYELGQIKLEPASANLGEVTVKAEHIPVMIKKDTVEFNAKAFQTQPNAVVEDLLKKLPGVEVAQDGTIKAQGEEVRQVMVEGKEFFGRDPKVATQNLPANAIDKVQVFDKKSDAANFSGIDDGQSEKAINLKLKPDKKQGFFGNATAGYGTNDRYDGRLSLNRFNDKQQFSLLALGNNINRQGFSIDDYLNFTGQLQRMRSGGGSIRLEFNSDNESGIPLDMGGAQGLNTAWAAGLNFNRQLNSKTEVNGSYFYNRFDNKTERETNRQTFLPNSTFSLEQNSNQHNRNDNHRLNFTLDHKIDSFNLLKWTNSLAYNETNLNSQSDTRTLGNNQELENDGQRQNTNEGQSTRWNSDLLYRHKFARKGRTMSAGVNFAINQSDRAGDLTALNRYFLPQGGLLRADTIRQTNSQTNDVMNMGANASYTEPLGGRKYLEFNYAYQRNSTQLDRDVYDIANGESVFNDLLSNRFNNTYDYQRGGLGFRLARKKLNFSTGLQLQRSGLEGELISRDTFIRRTFTNWLPNLHLNYEFSGSSHFQFSYETQMREPSIEQLQPIVDNSDPLNIYIGNPQLSPEYAHNFGLNFASFNQATFSNFFANINLTYATDHIAEAQTISPLLVRTWQPVNVKDDYNADVYANYGFPIRKLKSRIGISSNLQVGRGISLINEIENRTRRLTAGGTLSYEFTLDNKFDFNVSANLSYNQTQYSLDAALNQDFINQAYNAGFNWFLPAGFALGSDLDYSVYNGISSGFDQAVPLWGAYASKAIIKKRGELKLSVFDILNRNVGISRRADVNYIETVRTRSLGRYALLSFTYSLSPMGGGARWQGGGMRIIRR